MDQTKSDENAVSKPYSLYPRQIEHVDDMAHRYRFPSRSAYIQMLIDRDMQLTDAERKSNARDYLATHPT